MGKARSASAAARWPGGTNQGRGTWDRAARTRGLSIPRARTWRAIAAPGAGSGGAGMGILLHDLEVAHLQLDLAPTVPFVDRGGERQRAEGPGGQLPAPVGHVP